MKYNYTVKSCICKSICFCCHVRKCSFNIEQTTLDYLRSWLLVLCNNMHDWSNARDYFLNEYSTFFVRISIMVINKKKDLFKQLLFLVDNGNCWLAFVLLCLFYCGWLCSIICYGNNDLIACHIHLVVFTFVRMIWLLEIQTITHVKKIIRLHRMCLFLKPDIVTIIVFALYSRGTKHSLLL